MRDSTIYVRIAKELYSKAQKCSAQEAHPILQLVISTLDLLLLNMNTVPIEEELHARIMLATILLERFTDPLRAEDILNKGLLRIGSQERLVKQKMMILYLLSSALVANGSHNVARRVVKDAVSICSEYGTSLIQWHYTFLFRSYELDGSLSALRNLRALALGQKGEQLLPLLNLLESIACLSQGLPIPAALSPQLPSDIDESYLRSLSALDYMCLTVSILGDVFEGRVSKSESAEDTSVRAMSRLEVVHRGLDLRPDINMEIHISASSTDPQCLLTFETCSARHFMIFTYALSGIVYLADVTSSRSEKFLREAQKQLAAETNRSPETSAWNSLMATNLHIFQALNAILHQKFATAEAEIKLIPTSAQESRADDINLLKGFLAQATGDLPAALQFHAKPQHEPHVLLAKLCTVLIYRGSSQHNSGLADTILLNIEARCNHGPLATAFQLVASLKSGISSVALKRTLTTVLNTSKIMGNTQINILALSILGIRGSDPDDMRVKFLSYAISLASKSAGQEGSIWTLFNARLVERQYIMKNDSEKLQKVQTLAKRNIEALQRYDLLYSALRRDNKVMNSTLI